MKYIYDDGGRKAAGFVGDAGDCVARAVSIASGRPYAEVYEALAAGAGAQRVSKRLGKQRASAREGISTSRKWFKTYMQRLGFTWVPTMAIGSGCKVHLREDELPRGRLVVAVSKHLTAVIDGAIHDTDDPQRLPFGTESDAEDISGTRCVYGYYILTGSAL